MPILVIAEHENQKLKPITRNAISAAKGLGGDIHVLIAGSGPNAVAEEVAKIPSVEKVIVADAGHLAVPTAENMAAAVIAALESCSYTHVMATATSFAKNFLPRVAAKLDVAQASDIIEILAPDTFVRPVYAGAALATVQLLDSIKVVSVRATAFDPVNETGGHAVIETLGTIAHFTKSKVIKRDIATLERPDLVGARVIVSGGRGMAGEENFRLLEAVADKLGAAIGASRGAVDAGYAPSDYQVGQTGKVVAPELYIAVGISGAIQHLAGMQDSKVIVAINRDPESPIFEVASYGLVGDLFEELPQLARELA